MRKRKKNIDTLCEFRPGDRIVRIDQAVVFTVVSACQTTDWYELSKLGSDGLESRHVFPKKWIDEFYVLIDHEEER